MSNENRSGKCFRLVYPEYQLRLPQPWRRRVAFGGTLV